MSEQTQAAPAVSTDGAAANRREDVLRRVQAANAAKKDFSRLVDQAHSMVVAEQTAGAYFLQRWQGISEPQAAAVLDELESRGVVGPAVDGQLTREVFEQPDPAPAPDPVLITDPTLPDPAQTADPQLSQDGDDPFLLGDPAVPGAQQDLDSEQDLSADLEDDSLTDDIMGLDDGEDEEKAVKAAKVRDPNDRTKSDALEKWRHRSYATRGEAPLRGLLSAAGVAAAIGSRVARQETAEFVPLDELARREQEREQAAVTQEQRQARLVQRPQPVPTPAGVGLGPTL